MDGAEGDDQDAVFRALADPGRRRLLDALFTDDGRTLGQLCEVLPELTRFGVMKHLGVLEAANLIVTRRSGRSKLHHLNAVPIRQIERRWISKYTAATASALVDLAEDLSTREPGSA